MTMFDSQQHSHFIFMDLYVTNFSHNPAIREMQQNSKDFKIQIAITQKNNNKTSESFQI